MDIDPPSSEATATDSGNTGSEIKNYNVLIKKLLSEVDARRLLLENSRYTRIKDGVLNIHSGEVMRIQLSNGGSITELDHSLFEAQGDTQPRGDTVDSVTRERPETCYGDIDIEQHSSHSVGPTSHHDYGAENPPFCVAKSPASDARSPPPEPQAVMYGPAVAEPPHSAQTEPLPNSDDTKGPAGKETSSEHRRVPDDTTLGDEKLLRHLGPNRNCISNEALERALANSSMQSYGSATTDFYKCHHPGCTAPPFQSQYLLK